MNTALAAASHTLKISAKNQAVPTTQRVINTMDVKRSAELAFPQRLAKAPFIGLMAVRWHRNQPISLPQWLFQKISP
tara:strand:+ start:2146 stop:2376 length:231 start_codon:yes stop_codon:yes gene_type:complete